MDGRYEVFATHGKGVFSSVLRARDKQNPVPGTEVAIKMIRSNETMYKAAQTEKVFCLAACACCTGFWSKPRCIALAAALHRTGTMCCCCTTVCRE